MAGLEGLFLSVVGKGVCSLFKAAPSGLKLQPHGLTKRDDIHYTAHAWLAGGSSALAMQKLAMRMFGFSMASKYSYHDVL